MEKIGREELARRAVAEYFKNAKKLAVDKKILKDELLETEACFVTVTKNGQLRGCIGTVEAFEPLYENIVRNAITAVSEDPRFAAITREELVNIKFEVSVLTKPEELVVQGEDRLPTLLRLLRVERLGVIIELLGRRAVYLPQVWKELPEAEAFLSSLCEKAGLPAESWLDERMQFWTFGLVKEE